jgi:hypothetical protein
MVSCILHNFDTLTNYPPYTALSYTWGPDYPRQDIRVNGALFEVREKPLACASILEAIDARRMGYPQSFAECPIFSTRD